MGTIQVTIEQAQRMKAISDLAEAVKLCARALSLPPEVMVRDCVIQGSNTGILIDTAEDVQATIIKEVDDAEG